jgi:hypothetical protein
VAVGIVSHSSATTGTIEVNVVVGDHLEWLHDVLITTPTNGQVLKYDSTSGLWKNQTDAVGAVTSVAGRTGAVVLSNTDISGLGTMATASAADYSTTTVANGLYYPLSGNPSGFLTSSSLTGYATESWVSSFSFATESWVSSNFAQIESPTFTGAVTIPSGASISGYLTTSSAASTYAPLASPALTGNPTAPTPATSDNDTSIATTAFVKAQGYLTSAPVTSVAGKTGVVTLVVADVSGAAPLASPSLTGTPTSTTAAADTNTTQIATTAYVVGQAGSAIPLVDGTAAVGTSLRFARQDHVHPTDTSRAALASPTFTGVPAAPTAVVDTNTTQLATTAYVVAQAAAATPLVDGTAAVGTSLRYARADHVHPTDTTRAPLASPALTGTPTAPTATAGTNTTQLATTAFVTAAVPAFATFSTPGPTSTTTVVSPKVVMDFMMHPGFRQWNVRGSSVTSGAGAVVQAYSTGCTEVVGPNVSVAGFSMAIWDTGTSSFGMLGMTRGANGLARAWNKPVWASGRGQHGFYGDANYNGTVNSVVRVSVGGKSFATSGDISINDPGFGWYYIPGSAMVLQVSRGNGTSLTNVTTSFTPNAREIFDWKIYSDGAGNVTLYINDSQVATTTAGPTTATAESFNFYFESVEQTASAAARIVWESINPKVYWGV